MVASHAIVAPLRALLLRLQQGLCPLLTLALLTATLQDAGAIVRRQAVQPELITNLL
jgi:hypothetical protein